MTGEVQETQLFTFDFGQALKQMNEGKCVARQGWNGKGMYLYKTSCVLPYPPLPEGHGWKSHIFSQSEFIVMKTAHGGLIPWLASQTDILAEDWNVFTFI